MIYQVELSRNARDYLLRLDSRVQARLVRRIDQIAAEPFSRDSKPLTGPGRLRSSRVGAWRIVFSVDEDARVVEINRIGPRGQVYRGL